MKRLLWLGVGLAVGALVVRKLTRKAEEFTPTGIATSLSQSAGGLVESMRSFVEDVRDGMAEREQQIHEAFAAGELYEDTFAELRDDTQPGSQGGIR
ncbi:hypothetical protein [Actinoplanes teichomyceticus]|uniref:Uncharacterized protein n=1 Tax=Actinoplanes teichomyceticus TaxID=1867 RepID=A0A561VRC3_ACTTI|nr:hypothetical protein [Actinoplanes teichomyceticus]TWG14175.1 hypothetical protein FHX34_104475 [Actinoplanes teichomyceticus]GIF13265.1 hypothetical protein Ate01nite_32970 [Actinoplanes teichomyceticus]